MIKNSIDVIRPFAASVEHRTDVQIVGGLGSVALLDTRTVIDAGNQTIIAPDDLYLSTQRDNGSRRDIDVLVTSSDPARIGEVVDTLNEAVGDDLERSVFGFRSAAQLDRIFAHPMGPLAAGTFLADRYGELGNGGEATSAEKSLFPFRVPLSAEAMEPWRLEIGQSSFWIPNPAVTVLNYSHRSISGLRGKDEAKIARVSERVFADAPELRDWIIDGPGRSQAELTSLINSLRPHPPILPLPYDRRFSLEEMANHEAFGPRQEDELAKRAILGTAAFKARGLAWFEHNEAIVAAWQRFSGFERLFGGGFSIARRRAVGNAVSKAE